VAVSKDPSAGGQGGRRFAFVLIAFAAVLLAIACVHVLQGSAASLDGATAWRGLWAPTGLAEPVSSTHHTILWNHRMPRLLLAILAGASLATAGTVMQATFRNPLASPEIVGTTSGAALGGVIAIVLGAQAHWVHAVPLASFVGALVVTFLVFLFAGRGTQFSVTSLLLAGIAINTLAGSLVSFVTTLSFGEYNRSGDVLFWLMGGLDQRYWHNVASTAVGALVFGLMLLPFVRDLDLLTLRDDSAASLGVDAGRRRRILVLVACGLTGATVANTGGITFVGLVVPHMTRLLVGPAHRRLLPAAALMGAIVLVGTDTICRLAPVGANLRLGVVTSLLGAPFFLLLLAKHRRGEAL